MRTPYKKALTHIHQSEFRTSTDLILLTDNCRPFLHFNITLYFYQNRNKKWNRKDEARYIFQSFRLALFLSYLTPNVLNSYMNNRCGVFLGLGGVRGWGRGCFLLLRGRCPLVRDGSLVKSTVLINYVISRVYVLILIYLIQWNSFWDN